MGKAQRRKGQVGEREARAELCRLLELPSDYGVRGDQSKGGHVNADVEGFPWWVEVKRRKNRPNVHLAYEQALRDTDGREPLVLTRKDRGIWLATMSLDHVCGYLKAP